MNSPDNKDGIKMVLAKMEDQLRMRKANWKGKAASRHYEKHCHKCNRSVDSNNNKRCHTCGWYICECGACGCNFKK